MCRLRMQRPQRQRLSTKLTMVLDQEGHAAAFKGFVCRSGISVRTGTNYLVKNKTPLELVLEREELLSQATGKVGISCGMDAKSSSHLTSTTQIIHLR
jgi:hypothetical protein